MQANDPGEILLSIIPSIDQIMVIVHYLYTNYAIYVPSVIATYSIGLKIGINDYKESIGNRKTKTESGYEPDDEVISHKGIFTAAKIIGSVISGAALSVGIELIIEYMKGVELSGLELIQTGGNGAIFSLIGFSVGYLHGNRYIGPKKHADDDQ